MKLVEVSMSPSIRAHLINAVTGEVKSWYVICPVRRFTGT